MGPFTPALVHACKQTLLQPIAQRSDPRLRAICEALPDSPDRGAEPHDAGQILSPRPALPLMRATVEQRLQRCAASHPQRAHTLRPVQLVPGQAQQVSS